MNMNKLYAAIVLLAAQQPAFAANFSILPYGTLPKSALPGQTVAAYFNILNNTHSLRSGYTIKGPPTNVVQNTSSGYCESLISLNAGESCLLELDITGPASFHFAVCKAENCTSLGLDVEVSSPTQPRFAYITNYDTPYKVTVCGVNPATGSLENCGLSGGSSAQDLSTFQTVGITISPDGPTAYLSGYYASGIVQCKINSSTGKFGNCSYSAITSPPNYSNYYGFLALNSNNTMLFTTSSPDGNPSPLLSCPISANITGEVCQNTGAQLDSNQPSGFILNDTNTISYIANVSPTTVTTCAVNWSNGTYQFTDCGQKIGGGPITFSQPTSIALNAKGNILYITDQSKIYGCYVASIDTTSVTFQSCFVANTSISNPSGIVINDTNTQAYITGTNAYSCPIINDTFSTCTTTFNAGGPDIALLY